MFTHLLNRRRNSYHCRSKVHDQGGGSAIEFAIVLPVFLALLFGMIEFGVLMFNKAVITNASREGARLGIVFSQRPGADGDYGTDDDTYHPFKQDIKDTVKSYAQNYLITFGNDRLEDDDIAVTPENPQVGASGDSLAVSVGYQYDFLILPGFVGRLMGGLNLRAITEMRFE